MMLLPIFVIILSFFNYSRSVGQTIDEKKIFCLYFIGSINRPSVGHVEVEDINENYCTHLIYAELGINSEGQVGSLKPNLDFSTNGGKDNLRRFNKKKKYKTNLKTLVGIGGWSQSSERYSKIFADEKKRKVFIESVLSFLTKYQFDGIVLHWVFPGIFGGNPNLDRFTLTKLLKELKTEFQKKNFILALTGHCYNDYIDKSYNVKEIVKIVDYIILYSYDFYMANAKAEHIGIASGLYLHPKENNKRLSTDSAVNYWLLRVRKENTHKIIMGIPFFSRTFTLKYSNETTPGAPHIGVGKITEYFQEAGRMSYMELCQRFLIRSWSVKWEPTQKNPYAFKDDQWVGFENERSLKFKAKYVIDKNLGGVSIFDILDDDVKGLCGEKYPLLKALHNHLRVKNESNSKYKIKSNLCLYSETEILKVN